VSNEAVSRLFGSSATLALVPPAAGSAHAGEEDDPVATLFRANPVQRSPTISLHPPTAHAAPVLSSGRSSMFEERVVDPPPPAQPVARIRPTAVEQSGSGVHAPPPPPAEAAQRGRGAPQPPPAAPSQAKIREGAATKKPAPPAAPESVLADAGQESGQTTRRRRVATGPSKTVLVGLAVLTMLVAAAAAVLLGVLPDPRSPSPNNSMAPARSSRPAMVAAPSKAPVASLPTQAPTAAPAQAPEAAAAMPAKPVAKAVAEPAPAATAAPAAVVAVPITKPVSVPPPAAASAAKPSVAAVAAAPIPVQSAPTAAPSAQDEGTQAGSSDMLVSLARKLLAADDAAGAEAAARRALIVDPKDHHAMEVLARALMDQDRGAEALPYARIIVKARRNRVPYWLLYGDLLLMTGDEAGAKSQWQTALALDPTDRDTKRRLGL
jgi:predicted negative regulator of RcsB-dependent stress response